jgi:peptidoglycan/LPS O-acetylase OafA/YrhL
MTSTLDDHLQPVDPPALRGLLALEHRTTPTRAAQPAPRIRPRWSMGYQPGLDGLRAVSVVAVILYHAGFGWMHGGFFGVEVFFVVSGFLITSLLLEEHGTSGTVSLASFWKRRARRLLPALLATLVVVAAVAALLGTAEQRWQLRRDLPWSLLYAANWGQILGDVPYFTSGDPPLLRHLWSLAVEEQWYLVWPLVFLGLTRTRMRLPSIAGVLAVTAVAAMGFTWWLHAGGPGPLGGPPGLVDGADRTNLMYLSTITRSSGLLLGAAAAFVWRPWRSERAADADPRGLDLAGGVAVGALLCVFGVAALTEGYVYQWLLPLVSVLSLVAVLVVVHPGATGMRSVFSSRALVAVGKRSYGLYLWHWPVFVLMSATDGSVARFVAAALVSVAVSEACYRFVEQPVRAGALARWWASCDENGVRVRVLGAAAAVCVGLVAFYASVDRFDVAEGGEEASFEVDVTPATAPVVPVPATASPAINGSIAPSAASTAAPLGPTRMAIVGDSQAHSLAVNLPDGIDDTFDVVGGSVDGCGVHDAGRVLSRRDGFSNSFSICDGWQQEWASAAADADVALVVIGAWDVFDLDVDGARIAFGTPRWDERFIDGLGSGVDAMVDAGARVALLEVACMRPQDVEGAGVPALPERGDDARVAHVNELLRRYATAHSDAVTFIEGPDAWCADESVSTDLGYRWDGVHVYRPGAALIYDTIAPSLLALPALTD